MDVTWLRSFHCYIDIDMNKRIHLKEDLSKMKLSYYYNSTDSL
jgi:hypothetical protein